MPKILKAFAIVAALTMGTVGLSFLVPAAEAGFRMN